MKKRKTVFKPADTFSMAVRMPWADRIRVIFGCELGVHVSVHHAFLPGADPKVIGNVDIERFFLKWKRRLGFGKKPALQNATG